MASLELCRRVWAVLLLAVIVIVVYICYRELGSKAIVATGGGWYGLPVEYGYVLALHYSDQMTAGTVNLLSMQCWAVSLSSHGSDVRVVEPFVRRSVLGVDDLHRINATPKSGEMKSVRLSDVFNRSEWDQFASRRGMAPFISWDYFIQNAGRKMIAVERVCRNKHKCMDCGDQRTKDLLLSMQVLTDKYGFEIVRKVCYPMKSMKNSELKELIYGNYSAQEVVVLFNYWGGIDSDTNWRMAISDKKQCTRRYFIQSFRLSKRLKQDAKKYIEIYISKQGYISVMVRLEYFYLRHDKFKGMSNKETLYLLEGFYKEIVKKVNALKAKRKISDVFLTMDCRKQGSGSFSANDSRAEVMTLMSNSIINLFRMLYGNSSSLEEWDESFYTVSSFRTEGYMAMLQKHLAATGTCLITGGGGSFQDSTRALYHRYITHEGNVCFLSNYIFVSAPKCRDIVLEASVGGGGVDINQCACADKKAGDSNPAVGKESLSPE